MTFPFVIFATIDGAIKANNRLLLISQEWNLESRRFILQHLRQSLKNEARLATSQRNRQHCEHKIFHYNFQRKQLKHRQKKAVALFHPSKGFAMCECFKISAFPTHHVHFRQMNFNYDRTNNLNFVTGIKQQATGATIHPDDDCISSQNVGAEVEKHFSASVNWKRTPSDS